MIKEDYIMRLIKELVSAIREVWLNEDKKRVGYDDDIEGAVGEAINIDPNLFFSLDPDSAVQLMDMGDVTDDLALYVSRAIFYEAKLLEANGDIAKATLRRRQATAIAKRYKCPIPQQDSTAESLVQLFLEDLSDNPVEGSAQDEQAVSEAPEAVGASIEGIPLDKLKF